MAEIIQQGTIEWQRQRIGSFNGSEVGDLMVKGRGKDQSFGQTALSLIAKVMAERFFSKSILNNDDAFQEYLDRTQVTTKAMDFGHECEELARQKYAELNGVVVEEVSSIPHPTIPYFRSSPDGIIKTDDGVGCLEIKCPQVNTFGKYLLNLKDAESLKAINATYYWQCYSHMAVTGADYTDFMVYCPWMEKDKNTILIRIERDPAIINELESRVIEANEYIEEITLNR